MSVRCIDAESRKVANWANLLHYAFELENGILARRPLGTSSGRTGGTAALVEVVCRSQT